MAILIHDAGKGLLEFCHLRDNTTPLRLLVQHMPGMYVYVAMYVCMYVVKSANGLPNCIVARILKPLNKKTFIVFNNCADLHNIFLHPFTSFF